MQMLLLTKILLLFGVFELSYGNPKIINMTIKEFEEKYNETFDTPENEAVAAKQLELELADINKQNELFDRGEGHFMEDVHEWDDMTPEELADAKTGLIHTEEDFSNRGRGVIHEEPRDLEYSPEELKRVEEIFSNFDRDSLPEFYDSRALGLVTKVKDQGNCGSCVAFATAAAMEICFKKAAHEEKLTLEDLDISEEQMLDCGLGQNGADGCSGASSASYPKFMVGKEVNHEKTYPYAGYEKNKNRECEAQAYWNPGAKLDEVIKIKKQGCWKDEATMMHLIMTYGSVSTDLTAGDKGFWNYKSGVSDTCTESYWTDHQVLVVGWGTENDIPYWLIKNSWGKNFGDEGYIKIKRGTCGVGRWSCIAMSCSKIGDGIPDSKIPDPSGENPEEKEACDVNHIYGPISGKKKLVYKMANGKKLRCKVNCQEGFCTARNKNVKNSCECICGEDPCS